MKLGFVMDFASCGHLQQHLTVCAMSFKVPPFHSPGTHSSCFPRGFAGVWWKHSPCSTTPLRERQQQSCDSQPCLWFSWTLSHCNALNTPNPAFPIPWHSGAVPAEAEIFVRTDRWAESSAGAIKTTQSVLQDVNWSKSAFQVFSQTGSPGRRKVVSIILRQHYSLEENFPEAVRQSPCSHGQPSHKNSAVFHFLILYQHIVLFKMKKNKCERCDLSGADGCESGHKWAVSASNDDWNKSLEDWRQSKVGVIKCSSP